MSYNLGSNRVRNFKLILKLLAQLLPELYSTPSNYYYIKLHNTKNWSHHNNNNHYHGYHHNTSNDDDDDDNNNNSDSDSDSNNNNNDDYHDDYKDLYSAISVGSMVLYKWIFQTEN